MAESAWLWLYVICMSAGALLFFSWSRNPSGVARYEYVIAMIIPIWSGLAYMAMALGQGIIEVDGREIYLARYLDWLVTTPLLLWALASTAMFHRPLNKSLIGALMVTDVIMILSGLFADLTSNEAVQWLWYIIGCVCLALVLWITWGPLRQIAADQGREIKTTYTRVVTYLTVLWLGYPLIWALSPSGVGLFGQTTSTALFVVLPIFSKVGFSILDLHELRKLGQHTPQGPKRGHRDLAFA